MDRKVLFIHLSPKGILSYISGVLCTWNIRHEVKILNGMGSWYIELELGTTHQPKTIRISNHDSVYEHLPYDYDVVCRSARKGAYGIRPVTYLRLLETLAIQLNRKIPSLCRDLLEYRKEHSLELQYNRRHQDWRPSNKRAILYVNAA